MPFAASPGSKPCKDPVIAIPRVHEAVPAQRDPGRVSESSFSEWLLSTFTCVRDGRIRTKCEDVWQSYSRSDLARARD